MRICRVLSALWIAVAAVMARPSHAADAYPTHPVRLVVPFPPGGGNDAVARVIAQKLSERLAQQIVIDNRGGAGGIIGAQLAAKSPPDGYTLFFGQTHTLTINPHLYANLPYDPQKDFAPVALLASVPLVLVVNPAVPATSVQALIALAKQRPGQINFASPGNGSDGHLIGELFKTTAGIAITHVPYKGTGPALTDLLAGQVQIFFCTLAPAVPHIQAGTLRALAVTSARRSTAVPDVPTVAEAGVPGFEAAVRYGILAPAGTPPAIVARLNGELRQVVQDDAVRARFAADGAQPLTGTPQDYAADIAAELVKWGKVVRESGAHLD
jgi:tripartite-type tricarboxylate transporter receptor subunit TctC